MIPENWAWLFFSDCMTVFTEDCCGSSKELYRYVSTTKQNFLDWQSNCLEVIYMQMYNVGNKLNKSPKNSKFDFKKTCYFLLVLQKENNNNNLFLTNWFTILATIEENSTSNFTHLLSRWSWCYYLNFINSVSKQKQFSSKFP